MASRTRSSVLLVIKRVHRICFHSHSSIALTDPSSTARDYYIDHVYINCKWFNIDVDEEKKTNPYGKTDPISILKPQILVRKPWKVENFEKLRPVLEPLVLKCRKEVPFELGLLLLRLLYSFPLNSVPTEWWDVLRDRIISKVPLMTGQQFVTFAQVFQHRRVWPNGAVQLLQSKTENLILDEMAQPSIKDLGLICYSFARCSDVRLDSFTLIALLLKRLQEEISSQDNYMDYLPYSSILKIVRQSRLGSDDLCRLTQRLADRCAERLPLNEETAQLFVQLVSLCSSHVIYSRPLIKTIEMSLESLAESPTSLRSKDLVGLFSYLAKFDSQSAAKLFLTVVKSSLQPNSDGNVKWFPQVQALSLAFIGSKIGQYSSDLWIFICREKFLSTLSRDKPFLIENLYFIDCNMAIDSVNFGLRLPQNWYDIGRLTSTLVEDSRLHEVAEWLRNFLSSMGHDSFTVKIGRVLPHLLFKGIFLTWNSANGQPAPSDYLLDTDDRFIKVERHLFMCPSSEKRLVVLLVPAASCVFQQKNNLTTTDISYRLRMFKTIGYHTHLIYTQHWREVRQSQKDKLKLFITQFISMSQKRVG